MAAATAAQRPLAARPYQSGDQDAVLELVNADRVPGQLQTTVEMLAEALAGRSPVDGGWWAQLELPPRTDVVHDGAGEVLGVVSCAVRPEDGAGFVLWLHCRENEAVARALLEVALTTLGKRTVHAFAFASALTLGLEGLPVRHRPATRAALEAAGFAGRGRWRYLLAPLPIAGLTHAAHVRFEPCEDPPGTRLEIRGGQDLGEVWAHATVSHPTGGIGVLWRISVDPAQRGRGLGPALLGSALDLLGSLGTCEVILFVDDDAPADDPDRSRAAANRMYDRAGLIEVDRLWSFTRRP